MEDRPDTLNGIVARWPLILLSVILCASVLALVTASRAPQWTSTERILYGSDSSDLLSGATPSNEDVQRVLATQAQVVTSDQVLSGLSTQLHVSLRRLQEDTQVTVLPDSSVLEISVSAPSARQAAFRTRQVAKRYENYTTSTAKNNLTQQAKALKPIVSHLRRQLANVQVTNTGNASSLQNTLSTTLQRQIQLSSASKAETGAARSIAIARIPRTPSSLAVSTSAALGAAAGLMLGVGLALVFGRGSRLTTGGRFSTGKNHASAGKQVDASVQTT